MSVHRSLRHDSALKHVAGEAVYIDDMPEPPGTLHGALVLSPVAHGKLNKVSVPPAPGVVAVLGPADIPGKNDIAPTQNEPLFATDEVIYAGQPLLLVVATSLDAARHAAEKAIIEIDPLPALLDIEAALAAKAYVQAPATILQIGRAHV